MVVMNRMKRVPDMNVDIKQIKIILIECIVEIDIKALYDYIFKVHV